MTPNAVVRMQKPRDPANPNAVLTGWEVWLPDGTLDGRRLDTTDSYTQGLQESLDYANTYGYEHHILGGREPSTGGAVVLNCTRTPVLPPMQGQRLRWGAVTINVPVPPGEPGLLVDSCLMVDFALEGGQIVYQGQASQHAAVVFKPRNPVPVDGLVTVQNSQFRFTVCGALRFDLSGGGSVAHTLLDMDELNAGGQDVGLQVTQVGPGSNFGSNRIACRQLHGWRKKGLEIGTGPTAAGQVLGANRWDVHLAKDPEHGGDGIAIDTWAIGDRYKGELAGLDWKQGAQKWIERAPGRRNRFDFEDLAACVAS
jgi:hypothetical protein